MSRIAVARVVSTVGHPVVLMLVAALTAATARGASPSQLRFVGGALGTLAVAVIGFSWFQVRSGRWQHVDASGTKERASLNAFLIALLLVGALSAWLLTRRPYMPVALALSAALIVIAMLCATWVKVSAPCGIRGIRHSAALAHQGRFFRGSSCYGSGRLVAPGTRSPRRGGGHHWPAAWLRRRRRVSMVGRLTMRCGGRWTALRKEMDNVPW